jgi:hypothetical protein
MPVSLVPRSTPSAQQPRPPRGADAAERCAPVPRGARSSSAGLNTRHASSALGARGAGPQRAGGRRRCRTCQTPCAWPGARPAARSAARARPGARARARGARRRRRAARAPAPRSAPRTPAARAPAAACSARSRAARCARLRGAAGWGSCVTGSGRRSACQMYRCSCISSAARPKQPLRSCLPGPGSQAPSVPQALCNIGLLIRLLVVPCCQDTCLQSATVDATTAEGTLLLV